MLSSSQLFCYHDTVLLSVFKLLSYMQCYMQFLGSGVVSHHTDFGGCQEVMDSLKPPRKRKKCKSTALIITFTASAMITTNAGMKVSVVLPGYKTIIIVV